MFVTAAIIGHIVDFIGAINAHSERVFYLQACNLILSTPQFREKMEHVKDFLHSRGISSGLNKRIQNYFLYIWSRQEGVEEAEVLQQLPRIHCLSRRSMFWK